MTTHVDPTQWSTFDPVEIPTQRTPWFVLLMMIFAMLVAVLMVVGFWMASSPQY
jgi:hypothetical protein